MLEVWHSSVAKSRKMIGKADITVKIYTSPKYRDHKEPVECAAAFLIAVMVGGGCNLEFGTRLQLMATTYHHFYIPQNWKLESHDLSSLSSHFSEHTFTWLTYLLKKTYLACILKNILFTWPVHWSNKKYVFVGIFAKRFKLTLLSCFRMFRFVNPESRCIIKLSFLSKYENLSFS